MLIRAADVEPARRRASGLSRRLLPLQTLLLPLKAKPMPALPPLPPLRMQLRLPPNFYDHPQNPVGNPVNFSTFLIDKNTGTILQQVNWTLPPKG